MWHFTKMGSGMEHGCNEDRKRRLGKTDRNKKREYGVREKISHKDCNFNNYFEALSKVFHFSKSLYFFLSKKEANVLYFCISSFFMIMIKYHAQKQLKERVFVWLMVPEC